MQTLVRVSHSKPIWIRREFPQSILIVIRSTQNQDDCDLHCDLAAKLQFDWHLRQSIQICLDHVAVTIVSHNQEIRSRLALIALESARVAPLFEKYNFH